MKKIQLILILLISSITYSQTIIATTEDGRKVILKNDNTWEFIKTNNNNSCSIDKNFVEPKGDKKNQKFLKRTGATVNDLKKHISIDIDCSENDIILLQLSEQLGNAIYVVCVNGQKLKYRRTGSVFFKDGESPLKN